MSLCLESLPRTNRVVGALILALSLGAFPRLVSAEDITIGKKCAVHAREWDQLQADKKWSLDHWKNNKEEYDTHVAYYAKKEGLLLRKMLLCDKCQDKKGKIDDLPEVGSGGDKPKDPNAKEADAAKARGEELAKIPPELLFPKHITIVAQPGEHVIDRVSYDLNMDAKGYKIIQEAVDRAFQDADTEWVFIVNDHGKVTRSWDRKRYEVEAKNRKR